MNRVLDSLSEAYRRLTRPEQAAVRSAFFFQGSFFFVLFFFVFVFFVFSFRFFLFFHGSVLVVLFGVFFVFHGVFATCFYKVLGFGVLLVVVLVLSGGL